MLNLLIDGWDELPPEKCHWTLLMISQYWFTQSSIHRHLFCIKCAASWWRHQMEKFSALLAFCVGHSPVTGEFPSQRPVTRSFDVFFDLSLNKRLSKQWARRWFETQSGSLWRHCNVLIFLIVELCVQTSHVFVKGCASIFCSLLHNFWNRYFWLGLWQSLAISLSCGIAGRNVSLHWPRCCSLKKCHFD